VVALVVTQLSVVLLPLVMVMGEAAKLVMVGAGTDFDPPPQAEARAKNSVATKVIAAAQSRWRGEKRDFKVPGSEFAFIAVISLRNC
jgi:hypothetical protein